MLATAVAGVVQAQETSPAALEAARPADLRPRPRNISVSGDYLIGLGNITLPVGYALNGDGIGRSVQSPERNSSYYGASVSWQALPAWGFDLSYFQGTSTGNFAFRPEADGRWTDASVNSSFKLDDTWLQGYVRYRINRFSGTRFGAYLRGGVSYTDAKYEGISSNNQASYSNVGTIRDFTGNLGFGMEYRLFNIGSVRTRAVFEGEGFGGIRSREFTETTIPISGANTMDNMIYGGLGRLLLRADYNFGRSGEWKVFLEGGVQSRFTLESYEKPGRDLLSNSGVPLTNVTLPNGSQSELLWGPYVRAGLRYSF